MKRTRSLHALFATLVGGCGPVLSVDDDAGDDTATTETSPTTGMTTSETVSDSYDTYDTYDTACDEPLYIEVVEIAESAIAQWLDEQGQIKPGACWDICWTGGIDGEIINCRLLDDIDGDDPGPPEPEPGTTGGTTGEETSDESASSGDDATGTSGETDTITGEDPSVRVECQWTYYCGGGRGHEALQPAEHPAMGDPVGRWAAATAHAEEASVAAFLALRDELEAHGAPAELVARAGDAARDEIAHARIMTRVAKRRGITPARPRFSPIEVRALEAVATENAIEGCVRETWAALEATYQAANARDPDIRAAMTRIADDETRHAELARDIDAWLRTRLDAEAMRRVDTARVRAGRSLCATLDRATNPTLRERAGLPPAAVARRLAKSLRSALWS